VLLIFSMKSLT